MTKVDRTDPAPLFEAHAAEACRRRWSQLAKPLDSLGKLEDAVVQIAGITGQPHYNLDKRAVVVLCADNGVVAHNVTQVGGEITLQLADGIAAGRLAVNQMAKVACADVFAVDMGLFEMPTHPGVIERRMGAGTADISRGPAMTIPQAEASIQAGIDLVAQFKKQGYKIICAGEAGIGNTTTSSAMASVMLGCPIEQVTGRGAGLSSPGLARKLTVVEQAIHRNRPNPNDPLDVLSKLGGFDIAGLCGIYLGGVLHQVPIIIDGLISTVAALCASLFRPAAKQAMLASHVSAEPAGAMLLHAIGLEPLICADMRLGEGTGAVAALPLLDMAYAVYNGLPTFEEFSMEPYRPLT